MSPSWTFAAIADSNDKNSATTPPVEDQGHIIRTIVLHANIFGVELLG
jgi:hypothetical protein